MSQPKQYHISKGGNGWKVTVSGRSVSFHRTQKEALSAAAVTARRDGADIVTHRRDGRVAARDTFVPYERDFFKDSASKAAIVGRKVMAAPGRASVNEKKIYAAAKRAIRDIETGRWISKKSS